MKNLTEFATIKNLTDDTTKVVTDDGNIEELDANMAGFDFFAMDGIDDVDGSHALRPDGTHDGLDDLGNEEDDPFALGGFEGAEGEMEFPSELSGDEPQGEEAFNPEDNVFGEEGEEEGDPDFQGVVRTVTGACLVYKRKTEEGTFEELWVYNVGKNMRGEVKTRRAILAGTDIPAQSVSSEDGTQEVETTTIGNVQFLRIVGLPN